MEGSAAREITVRGVWSRQSIQHEVKPHAVWRRVKGLWVLLQRRQAAVHTCILQTWRTQSVRVATVHRAFLIEVEFKQNCQPTLLADVCSDIGTLK